MKGSLQRAMHCPCGKARMLALGLCATCYTLKRQDEEYLGGVREGLLERDGRWVGRRAPSSSRQLKGASQTPRPPDTGRWVNALALSDYQQAGH